MRTAADIRREFLEFFRGKGHEIVPAAPVIPNDDPTLLFTNAGMNQFKDVFLGGGSRPYKRAADTQPCIRAGGKHNDLDDVGHDTYHHTCFEMLGNWSFGDYFKAEAIEWAWDLLTKVWGLDPSRLHATYFEGDAAAGVPADSEARDLWRKIAGLPDSQIHAGNKKDNFWEMGDTGPCGPCTEIHIDLTPDKSGAKLVNAGDARVMEIWNLVFIQFNRNPDKSLTPLPAKHVDTGMGFERICSVVQGMQAGRLGNFSNYDTDVFTPLFSAIREVTGAPAYTATLPSAAKTTAEMIDVSYRVIADHIRTLSFAIADGCLPDKDGRGYVLRRILRRAVRYGWQYLKMEEPFLHRLAPAVVASLGETFPRLRSHTSRVVEALRDEEESFGRTLKRGLDLFDDAVQSAQQNHNGEIRGEDAFKLHDTFGFPIDLTQIMAGERGLRVDIGEYERLMDQAKQTARAAGKSGPGALATLRHDQITAIGTTDDSPKFATDSMQAKLIGVIKLDPTKATILGHGQALAAGDTAALVFDRTCFYAEQGGQIGDTGDIGGALLRFNVENTLRVGDTVLHVGTLLHGKIHVGDALELAVNMHRADTKKNHTATHVMNWALRETLGEHVQQKGSLVDTEKTRFDFAHPKALTPDELERVESLTNQQIAQNLRVYDRNVPQKDALKINGLRAVFGEKYPDVVRVVSIGAPVEELLATPEKVDWRKFSIEFCGGTHLGATGEIRRFIIVAEESVAKGVRRVVGLTGVAAEIAEQTGRGLLERAGELRSKPPKDLGEQMNELTSTLASAVISVRNRLQVRAILDELQGMIKQQQKAAAADSQTVARDAIELLLKSAARVGDTTLVVGEMPDVPVDQLKHAADIARQRCGSAALLMGVHVAGDDKNPPKAMLLAAMSEDLVKRGIKSGDLVKSIAGIVEGSGGGQPTMAQAGGKNPAKLGEALAKGRAWIEEQLRK